MKHLILTALAALAVSGLAAPKNPLRARTAGLYNRPTAYQLERCIAAAQGVAAPTNLSLYGTPTFSQVERLITALGSRSNETGVASWATAGNAAPITNVTINTKALFVNPETRTASGTIATCGPFPTGWIDNTTTTLFCESIVTNMDAANKTGVMYMGTVNLTDVGNEAPKRSEVIITVVADNRTQLSPTDPEDFQNEVILKLETTSTNNRMRHWMTMYEKFGKKKDVYNTWPRGKISYGGSNAPWLGMLFKPLDNQSGAQAPLTESKYIAASMEDIAGRVSTSQLNGQSYDLSNDTQLKNALKAVIEALGGTVTNP